MVVFLSVSLLGSALAEMGMNPNGCTAFGRAGAGVAISGDSDGMGLNPASLAALPQSSLQQAYFQSDFCKKASQNIIFAQSGIIALGGQVNLFYSPDQRTLSVNYDTAVALRVLRFLSVGVLARDLANEKPKYDVGAILGYSSEKRTISRLELGFLQRNIGSGYLSDLAELEKPKAENGVMAAHLRLKTATHSYLSFAFDNIYLANGKEIPFQDAIKRVSAEQKYGFGEHHALFIKTGVEIDRKKVPLYSVGVGVKSGFLSVDMGLRNTKEMGELAVLSVTYQLAEKRTTVSSGKNASATKVRTGGSILGAGQLKCKILPVSGLDPQKTAFIISVPEDVEIGLWMVHLIDLKSNEIVKTISGKGPPPLAVEFELSQLTGDDYRVDFSCVTEDSSQTGISECVITRKNGVIMAKK